MKPTALLVLAVLALAPLPPLATEADPHAQDRQALLTVFRAIEAAINAGDVEGMVAQMAPDATVTWLNGEVSRGHEQIRAYYHRMVKGNDRILDRYVTSAKVAAPARFFGDVAVADGTMEDEFFPVRRGPFRLSSNWTSTSARVNGQWKVVSLHLSANVFTNSLLAEAERAALYAGGVGLLVGVALTWLVGRLRRRR